MTCAGRHWSQSPEPSNGEAVDRLAPGCQNVSLACGCLNTCTIWALSGQDVNATCAPERFRQDDAHSAESQEEADPVRSCCTRQRSAKQPVRCWNAPGRPLAVLCIGQRLPWRRRRAISVILLVMLRMSSVLAASTPPESAPCVRSGRSQAIRCHHPSTADVSEAMASASDSSEPIKDIPFASSSFLKEQPRSPRYSSRVVQQRRLLQTIQGDPPAAVLPAPSGSVPNNQFSGSSYYNPTDFPLPAGYQPVISSVHRIMGREALINRLSVEQAFKVAFGEAFGPLGIQVRWLNYTTYRQLPSDPTSWYGDYRTDFRAIDQQALIYQQPPGASNLTMGSVFNWTTFLQKVVTQQYGHAGVSLVVLSETALTQSFFQAQVPYGASRTVIELKGAGLLPFTPEKANAMLQTLKTSLAALKTSHVFFANFSSQSMESSVVTTNKTAVTASQRDTQHMPGRDTVQAVVWLGLQPLANSNMADLWKMTFNKDTPQPVYVVNVDGSIGEVFTYRDFTATAIFLSGLSVTGRYISSQLYQFANLQQGLIISNMAPGPPAVSQPPSTSPAPSPIRAVPHIRLSPAPEPVGSIAEAPLSMLPLSLPHRHAMSSGAIAGTAVAAVFTVILLLIAGVLLLWRRIYSKKSASGVIIHDKVNGSHSSYGKDSESNIYANGTAGVVTPNGTGAAPKWHWSNPLSGVEEPVMNPAVLAYNQSNSMGTLAPLYRANELFEETPSDQCSLQVGSARSDSLPPPGTRRAINSAPLARRSEGETASFINGSTDSFANSTKSAPFVAGEIDPSEIEICVDSNGDPVVLGKGAFGRVCKGYRRGVHEVAIKQIFNLSDPQLIRQFKKEIEILGRVSFQPNIVRFYGACLRDPTNIMLIMENMAGGDLRKALSNSQDGEFTWYKKGRTLALDISHGLHFLHSSQVTHRDLKTSNVLLSGDGLTAKIGDVGLSRSTLTEAQSSLSTVGTFAYAAPELLMGNKCTEAVDLFSYGVCLWEVVTGDIPVRGYLRDVLVPQECPAEVRQLISDCMETESNLRPTAQELVDRLTAIPADRPPEAAYT